VLLCLDRDSRSCFFCCGYTNIVPKDVNSGWFAIGDEDMRKTRWDGSGKGVLFWFIIFAVCC
jgi:hypothetical protein